MALSKQLQDRIKQHVTKWLRQDPGSQRAQPDRACKQRQPTSECDSAIGQHLLENDQCAANGNEDQFSILDKAHSPILLSLLVQMEFRFVELVPSEQRDFLHSIGRCTTTSQTYETVIHKAPDFSSRSHFDGITH